MEENEGRRKGFREKFLNKKVVIALAALVVVVVAGGLGLMEKASANPAFCASCHIMQSYYQSYHNSNLLANKHAKAGVTCHQCHQNTVAGQAKEGIDYITGNYKTPLDKITVSKDLCLKCHNYDTVKSKTNFEESNPHDSHNGQLECNTCHSMHQQSTVFCAQCHQFSWFSKLDNSWKTSY